MANKKIDETEEEKEERIEQIIKNIRPEDIVVDLEKCKEALRGLIYKDEQLRKELVRSIIHELKPEDIVIDWEKDKELIKKIEKIERTKLKTEIIYELKGTLEAVLDQFKYSSEVPAVKTEHYSLYSITDAHALSATQTLKDFLFKNKLRPKGCHQVLKVKMPLTFEDYLQKRDGFLSELGDYKFVIKTPRKRDQLLPSLKNRVLKEIAYGKGMNVAFYESKKGNYLEFIYTEDLKTGTEKIYQSLEKLLQ